MIELMFTKSHEWLRVEKSGAVTVGITDFAQHALTDIVFLELPEIGSRVQAGEACCTLESTKIAADVYAPADGEVISANNFLISEPELVNKSPQEDGWLFTIIPDKALDCSQFMTAEEYAALVEGGGHA